MRTEVEPGIEFRLMQAEDTEAIAILQSELDFSSWNQPQWLEALKHYPCAWVLEDVLEGELKNQNRMVGYVMYQTRVPQVELLNIGIASDYQGQGLAINLLAATIKLLPENSESIFLEVRRSNVPAIGLYEKLGFSKVGERRDYYRAAGGTREDALIYKYDLIAAR